ncbi:protein of unknown function [Candidatus Nitrosotalea okcheonensis]|uniref:Uncharacterized protein n=1 Tax=Candidatus Nitrosotalea okcheonensis TaxID=1903276 RepID=A0A2H1FHJ0_9ARCH|nr:protein of unknown function [Candidatus Nitrosotalea okcheonensis]
MVYSSPVTPKKDSSMTDGQIRHHGTVNGRSAQAKVLPVQQCV